MVPEIKVFINAINMQGSKVSETALESFSARLANWIIAGELALGNWSPERGAEIKVCETARVVPHVNS